MTSFERLARDTTVSAGVATDEGSGYGALMLTGASPAGLTVDADASGSARVIARPSQGIFATRVDLLLLLRLSRP